MMRRGAILALAALAATAAKATAEVARSADVPHLETAPVDQPPRTVPITGYTLALIWVPQHCFAAVRGAEALQCGPGTAGRGFVLHGLWPDGANGKWPQWCSPAAILPPRVIMRAGRTTPSPQLLQHEWAKHGTCIAGTTAGRYFADADRIYGHLRFPDMSGLAHTPLTEGTFAAAFEAANPRLARGAMRLNLTADGWLQEVWLCLDMHRHSIKCGTPDRPDRIVRIR